MKVRAKFAAGLVAVGMLLAESAVYRGLTEHWRRRPATVSATTTHS